MNPFIGGWVKFLHLKSVKYIYIYMCFISATEPSLSPLGFYAKRLLIWFWPLRWYLFAPFISSTLLPLLKLSEHEACWDGFRQSVFLLYLPAYVFFCFFGGVIMPPFVALQGLWLLFNQPICMNLEAHVVSAAVVYQHAVSQTRPSRGAGPSPRTYAFICQMRSHRMRIQRRAVHDGYTYWVWRVGGSLTL